MIFEFFSSILGGAVSSDFVMPGVRGGMFFDAPERNISQIQCINKGI